MPLQEKIIVSNARLEHLSSSPEIANKFIKSCFFCEKESKVNKEQMALSEKFSSTSKYYCNFCLQHGFHNRGNKDVLILSFKGIIGHLYYHHYLTIHKLWLSEIEDYVVSHEEAGKTNPIFLYDPETFLWFIDFNRVGNSKKKMPIEEIFKTIINIMISFNLNETVNSAPQVYFKFREAIDAFYRKRYRPENRKILIPTVTQDSEIYEKIKNFSLKDLKMC